MATLERIEIDLSKTTVRLLRELAETGIYGTDIHEVAVRLIDRSLERFVEQPRLTLGVLDDS